MKLKKIIFRSMILLLLVSACSKKKLSNESDFLPYIHGFTSGEISKYSTIRVILAHEVSNAVVGEAVAEDAFGFSPSLKGTAFWTDKNTLEFRPESPMKNNQEYIVEFHLSKFEKVEKKFENFVFRVHTIKQAINVETNFPAVNDEGMLTFNGFLYLTDRDELDKIQKTVSVSMDSKTLPVNWKNFSARDGGYVYEFSISNIQQKNEEQTLLLKWDGTPIEAENKGEKQITLPSNENLKLIGQKVVNGDDAHIELYFNVPLKPKQNFGSLCYLRSGDANLTYIQEGSLLKIYPSVIFFDEKELIIDPNLQNIIGNKLGEELSVFVKFENIKPAVRFVNKGVILPTTKDGLILPFQAVSLRAVDLYVIKISEENVLQFLQVNNFDGENEIKRVARPLVKKTIRLDENKLLNLNRWQTFSIDLGQLIEQEPGAIYRVFLKFKKSYSVYPCSESENVEDTMEKEDVDLNELWDSSPYDGDYYNFYYQNYTSYSSQMNNEEFWANRENPCHPAYYYQYGRNAQTNILASDFGIVAKSGENNRFFAAVTNMVTAMPEKNATVLFYNYQQQVIAKGTTDANGFVEIPLEKKPYFLEVQKDKQKGYLRLDDGNSLSLSNFDVSGETYVKGIKGFIYGERGVWRPGDTLHVTFIVQDEDKVLPQGHPITLEFTNPRNQLYSRMMQKYDKASLFYVFHIPTTADVPTGQWNINIRIGGSSFQKSVPVETVKPNRLKINLDVNANIIRAGSVPQFTIQSSWLQGAKASGKQADVKVKYRRIHTSFDGYKDYVFESPISSEFSSEEKILFSGKTDENGTAVFTKEMPDANNAPGMLQANFTTRVFEGEGDFSINYKTVSYSPYNAYLGIKVPKAPDEEGILYTNNKHTFDLVLVDENGKPTNSDDIRFTVYKLDWRWWWDSRDEDDLAYYINNDYASKYFTKSDISTQGGKASVTIEVPNKDWGRYLIVAKDEKGGHLTGVIVYFDWEDWLGRAGSENPNGATMLTFSTDKDNYKVGEKAKVSIPSSASGRALVTIENRSRVISAQWVETQSGSSSFEIPITAEMVPNAYIYITWMQPHGSMANDLPIRLYGVKNIMVEDKDTHLYPVINMLDKVEPEKKFTVNISEKSGKAMTYTLAIVDEGLLDLTNFKTPDPQPYFYRREALGVRSWDMFDYVIGAYGGKIEQLFAIGGDMQIGGKDADKTNNRFKPVVRFIGPCRLEAGKTNKHQITLPSYFGSVRTMVIAGNEHAYGNAEKAVKVQKPLMVMATLPRVAGINEDISLPVDVFAMDETAKNVTVTVTGGKILKVVGDGTQNMSFTQPGDKIVTFRLKAGETIGKEIIKVKAVSGTTVADYEIELEVRNPNPRATENHSYVLKSGEKINWPYKLTGMAGTNALTMEVSRIPSLNLESRLSYLIGYPHGCAEQTTSKGFPQLYLSKLMSLTPQQTKDAEENVKSTILKLTQMQRSDGAILYWMGGNYTYDWVTTYAGHFMLEAKNNGYAVSSSFLSQWANYQKQRAQEWSNYRNRSDYQSYGISDIDQAYRLYTLALYGKPERGAMNRLRELKNLSVVASWRLAAAYVLSGNSDVAEKIIAGLSTKVEDYSAFNNTFGSSLRDDAMILETLVLLKKDVEALKQAQLISAKLNNNDWYSTQTTAYALVGMSKFAQLTKADKNIKIIYTQNGTSFNKETQDAIFTAELDAKRKTEGEITVNNTGEGTIFLNLVQSGIPLDDKTPVGANGLSMNVQYINTSGDPISVGSLQQGTDFLAQVTIQNTSSFESYNEISLTQIFPSGWEILNDRMMQNGGSQDALITYQDIRDDRVLTYFNLKPRDEKTFSVRLNAAYAGKYFLPAVLCEAMYDNKIFARNQGEWVTVKK